MAIRGIWFGFLIRCQDLLHTFCCRMQEDPHRLMCIFLDLKLEHMLAYRVCAFDSCAQHFLSPSDFFLRLTTIPPTPLVSPCAMAAGYSANSGCDGCSNSHGCPSAPMPPPPPHK